ncbi:MAG TPA: DivIVA domain-containing protein [Bacilli bacterium]|nr:DivIVA domain-containing protein [Bacilli bacterium]
MRKFSKSIAGYNINEVNAFVDDVIKKVESILREESKIKSDILAKDTRIRDLEDMVKRYKSIEQQLNASIINAQESGEYIKRVAKSEGDAIINEARKNANRIVSDALLRAEKTEYETQVLKKNVNMFKNKVRTMLNQQLDIIDDLDKEIL